ncbi:hypothetical protein EDD16DRAFT_1688973 [Pisolithus croceorrhizus]|nr:hypothetical protein EDD16DRAFT_1688973 [Pisolithus croceorrhizus]
MSLPPVFYHYFRTPLPYARTLALQERLHQIQLAARHTSSHHDVLLLLQHRPVYTAGRRQTAEELTAERTRLTRNRRLTSLRRHAVLVGYPILDLGRTSPAMGTRDYVCRIQRAIQAYLAEEHGLRTVPSEHMGLFLDATTKVASIGVQEPLAWFDRVVACGLAGQLATGKAVQAAFGTMYGRGMERLTILTLEEEALTAGDWAKSPAILSPN